MFPTGPNEAASVLLKFSDELFAFQDVTKGFRIPTLSLGDCGDLIAMLSTPLSIPSIIRLSPSINAANGSIF